MLRVKTVGLVAGGAMLIGAQPLPSTGLGIQPLGGYIRPFLPCDNMIIPPGKTYPENVGVIRIRLPKQIVIGGRAIPRSVRVHDGPVDLERIDDMLSPGAEADNGVDQDLPVKATVGGGGEAYRAKRRPQPFHIYLHPRQFSAAGFVAVRVIVPKDVTYSLATVPSQVDGQTVDIAGAGVGDAETNTRICGRFDISATVKTKLPVATFYIDLRTPWRRGEGRSFNIALNPNGVDTETPVFIDPKVHNG